MLFCRKFIAFIFAWFAPLGSAALAADFEWLIHHRPPFRVWQDNGQVSGLTVDRARAIFAQAGLTYNLQRSTIGRTLAILEKNRLAACSEGWFQTRKREKFARFSDGFYRAMGIGLLTKTSNTHVIKHRTFESLFSDDQLIFGHRLKWSYGQEIDDLVVKHAPKLVSHNQTNEGSVEFLLSGKYDYQLVSLQSADYLIGSVKKGDELLVAQTMADSPPPAERHIMCSKKVPASFIQRMNAAIEALGFGPRVGNQ